MSRVTIGLSCLVAGYVLSQFYRAFLAVLAPVLQQELGALPGDLALSSGMWFVTFALAQLPIGWALDAIGPRRTAAGLLAAGGAGGAAIFAMATAPWHLHVAMGLIGVGCAPVLMAAYYLLARLWPPESFGAMAGVMVAVGSLGNILGASPLVALIQAAGWRTTLWGLAAVTLAVAAAIAVLVRDPPGAAADAPKGTIGALLRVRALWWLLPLIFVNYAASAAIRGVWAAPFLQEVHGADIEAIGRATLVMGIAMVAGNFLLGPFMRIMGSIRRAAIWGAGGTLIALGLLAVAPAAPFGWAMTLLGVIGLSGANYALLMTEGRALMPPHLLAYGMTFLNMVSIAGVGAMQFASRPVYRAASAWGDPEATFRVVFAFFALPLLVGLVIYVLRPRAPL